MKQEPYIKPEQSLSEITLRAVLLGALLSMILSAANAYFGLFAGMTVSASIPAAVISMAVLRVFRNSNILENNLVQTAASAGESLAAGVLFTIPALVLMGYWEKFNYLETTMISLAGGLLGILFTIPLRKALIVKENLTFPEGVATSEVLKTGEKSDGGSFIKYLIYGGLAGGLFKLSATAFNLWKETYERGILINNKIFLYYGMNLSPALVAVGYIVGLNVSFLVFLGGAISWYLGIPIYILVYGAPEAADAAAMGGSIWDQHIRYLGVGAMIVGGLWALISIRKSLGIALSSGLQAFKSTDAGFSSQLRTERDTPMTWVLAGIVILIIPIFFIYLNQIEQLGVSATMALVMVLAGFLFSSVAGYMAGLVGSSNNPISGVTIATILFSALLLATLMGTSDPARGAAGAILIGAVVCCAAAIAGDNLQDLKAGYVLGATPYKQQIMQIVGVVAGALVMAPVLNYLNLAFGIGQPSPANPDSDPLSAPQATLMQSVAEGIFLGNLPWGIISIGAAIGIVIIIIDQYLAKINSNFRMPVLAVAVGIYLPFELDMSIFIGGLIAWFLARYMKKASQGQQSNQVKVAQDSGEKSGILFASGLITGEALMGVLIAIIIVANNAQKPAIFATPPWESYPGVILFGLIIWWMIRLVQKSFHKKLDE